MQQRSNHHENDPHVLAGRLATGWVMCDQERDPTRKQRLEDHWLRLLREYERACDEGEPRSEQKTGDRFSRNGGLT